MFENNDFPDPIILTDKVDLTPENSSNFLKLNNAAKRIIQSAVIVAEVSPLNEAIRFGSFGVAQYMSGNAIVGAAVLGGSTLIVEGSAALAASEILPTGQANKTIGWVNKKLEKVVKKDSKIPIPAEIGAALVGGSVVVLAAKQIVDPSRTVEQNRRHGIFTASWMAGVFTVEGALLSEGIDNINDIKTVGIAALALGSITAGTKWFKNRFKKQTI